MSLKHLVHFPDSQATSVHGAQHLHIHQRIELESRRDTSGNHIEHGAEDLFRLFSLHEIEVTFASLFW